jgi:hypothetical protein
MPCERREIAQPAERENFPRSTGLVPIWYVAYALRHIRPHISSSDLFLGVLVSEAGENQCGSPLVHDQNSEAAP